MGLCTNYFVTGGHAFPCGQCMPCRWNRRRMWQHRIMLERALHSDSCFLSLTYNDNTLPLTSLPTGHAVASLEPQHLSLWLKRLRRAIEPLRIRYYAVGEYGDESFRPHFHAVLFGFPTCMRGRTLRRGLSMRPVWEECCEHCRLIGNTWGKGDVDLGEVNKDSAQYAAGYTVKKMTRWDDPRLMGRHPEFARMSLRPGIGSDAMLELAEALKKSQLDKRLDVPSSLRHGAKSLPLGRYLRGTLRELIGREKGAPQEVLNQLEDALYPLRLAARNSSENPSFKKQILDSEIQKVRDFTARLSHKPKGKSL